MVNASVFHVVRFSGEVEVEKQSGFTLLRKADVGRSATGGCGH